MTSKWGHLRDPETPTLETIQVNRYRSIDIVVSYCGKRVATDTWHEWKGDYLYCSDMIRCLECESEQERRRNGLAVAPPAALFEAEIACPKCEDGHIIVNYEPGTRGGLYAPPEPPAIIEIARATCTCYHIGECCLRSDTTCGEDGSAYDELNTARILRDWSEFLPDAAR